MYIQKKSYIPDVYVTFQSSKDINGNNLCDDNVFIKGVMTLLKAKGYTGPNFSRAELAMQDKNKVVLEPAKQFNKFAEKLGWIDQDKE